MLAKVLKQYFFLGLTCLGIFLGGWQWSRAEEKRILENYTNEVTSMQDLTKMAQPLWGAELELEGNWLNSWVGFLDNQLVNKKAGVDVYRILLLSNSMAVLVNLGWIPWESRDSLPELLLHQKDFTARVKLYPYARPAIKLGSYPELAQDRVLLPWIDKRVLEQEFNISLPEFELRVVKNNPAGFMPHWQLNTISSDKHLGYAIQWWLLACLSMGYWIWLRKA